MPYCVLGGTALAEGRGERLTPLPALPRCWVVVCKPEFAISTPELFARIDSVRLRCRPDTDGLLSALEEGDLGEPPGGCTTYLRTSFPAAAGPGGGAENALIQAGALGAQYERHRPHRAFGLFDCPEAAEEARAVLAENCWDTFCARRFKRTKSRPSHLYRGYYYIGWTVFLCWIGI